MTSEVMPGKVLRLHSSIGAGPVLGVYVGGVRRRWEYLLERATGSLTLDGLWRAMKQAEVGQIVLSPQMVQLVNGTWG